MSGKKVPNKVCIEVNEVDQALAGSSRIIPSSKASDPNGDVVGNYIILQDGTALDLSAHIAEQVAKQLATIRASSSGVGTSDKSASKGNSPGKLDIITYIILIIMNNQMRVHSSHNRSIIVAELLGKM